MCSQVPMPDIIDKLEIHDCVKSENTFFHGREGNETKQLCYTFPLFTSKCDLYFELADLSDSASCNKFCVMITYACYPTDCTDRYSIKNFKSVPVMLVRVSLVGF